MTTKTATPSDWRRLVRSVIMLAALLCAALPGSAQNYYILYNTNYGYLVNNNGTPDVSTSFNKNAIWNASGELGGTSRSLQSYTNNTQYLRGGDQTFGIGASQSQWRTNGGYLYNYWTTGFLIFQTEHSAYVKYNSGLVCEDGNGNNGERFAAAAITINNQAAANPTISITAAAGLSDGGIQLTGNVTGTYRPAYSYATVRNYNNATTQTYYWTNTTDATTTNPTVTDWADATRTWSVTTGGAYASVSSDGLVTITGNPTDNIVVTLTVTKGGYEGTQTFTLTRAAIDQSSTTETVITGPSISPTSAALYYNEGNQTFTSSATATATTTTVPAHTTLTGGGNTYYYYNSTLSTSAPTSGVEETHPAVTLTWSLSGAAASYLTRTPPRAPAPR